MESQLRRTPSTVKHGVEEQFSTADYTIMFSQGVALVVSFRRWFKIETKITHGFLFWYYQN